MPGRHHASEPLPPEPEPPLMMHKLIKIMLGPEVTNSWGRGGYGGSCYGCVFASEPLDGYGHPIPYSEYANDPTETLNRCYLPTREPGTTSSLAHVPGVEWGEYAPCTQEQWAELLLQVVPDRPLDVEELRRK